MSRKAQILVDHLLLEQGIYTPLELLSLAGALRYSHLEAWRLGRVQTLDGGMDGTLDEVRCLLGEAQAYALRQGFLVEPYALAGIVSESHTQRRFSNDAELNALLSVRFAPSESKLQLDLFTDSAASVLVNDLIDAIVTRRWERADQLFKELPGRGVDATRQKGLRTLREAQRYFNAPLQNIEAAGKLLVSTVEPLAGRHLGARFREFLTPLWNALGEAMNVQFDPAHPHLHPSYAYSRALSWDRVLHSVEEEPAWEEEPELCKRRAVALHRLGDRRAALAAWFDIFWHFPEQAQAAMDSSELPDPVLRHHWQAFCDLAPPLEPEDFPAWCLLAAYPPDPGYETLGRDASATAAFQLVCALVRAGLRSASPDPEIIDLRAQLKASHPVLFLHYMHGRSQAESASAHNTLMSV